MTSKPKKIENINQLKESAKKGCECFIILYKNLRSSKYIQYDEEENTFYVLNYVDDTEQTLTEQQLMDREYTNIGYAMTKGALFED